MTAPLPAAIERLERSTWDSRVMPARADVRTLLEAREIRERDDVGYVLICAPCDGEPGTCYVVGREGVTAIKIVARHGPMDWLPYVEVWKGDHLHSEVAQHQCVEVEFKPAQVSA